MLSPLHNAELCSYTTLSKVSALYTIFVMKKHDNEWCLCVTFILSKPQAGFINGVLAWFLVRAVIWSFLCGHSHVVFYLSIMKLLFSVLASSSFFVLVQRNLFPHDIQDLLSLCFLKLLFLDRLCSIFDIPAGPNAIPYLIYNESFFFFFKYWYGNMPKMIKCSL